MFTIIAAMDENGVIGRNNALPWHLPVDLRHFKAVTMGKSILMGRKTCESLPFALPGRENLVLTRNSGFERPGFTPVDMSQLLARADNEDMMVIGGASIYAQFLPLASRMLITHIHHQFPGDTWFPDWDRQQWKAVSRVQHNADAKNPWACDMVEYHRVDSASQARC